VDVLLPESAQNRFGAMISLSPEKGLIFRIIHIENIPWILENGLHCPNSTTRDPAYREIGNPDLIRKRTSRELPVAPGGTLSDYIPFYFTPYSPMLLNIKTGYGGIRQTPLQDIVILVASLPALASRGVRFLISDRHAYLAAAKFVGDLTGLNSIDWKILGKRDFKRDTNDPGKMERYQAEALIHRHLAVTELAGIMCYRPEQEARIKGLLAAAGISMHVRARPDCYV
jgi:hypothetical protein